MPGALAPARVGHVPRELSQYIWHAMERGAICGATVLDPTPRPSPLVQGRLEVLLELRVKSNDVQNLKKLQEKIRAVDFSEYKDQSKENLKEIGVDDESSDSETDFENDVGPSKNTRVVIMESDKDDY